jgi:RHS repeat-associated protein
MNRTSVRRNALACALLATTALATTPACAQSLPPTRSAIDPRGVDTISGTWMLRQSDLSIGPAGAGGLSYETIETGQGIYSHNFKLALTLPLPTVAKIELGERTIGFTKSGSVWTADQKDGWSMVETSSAFTLTDSIGVVYNFDKATAAGNPSYSFDYAYYDNMSVNAVATSVTGPNGIVITLTYQRGSWAWTPGGIASYGVRLMSVTSNAGYALSYHHPATSLASNGSNLGNWWGIDKVTAVNRSVDYCDPASNTCTASSAARYVSYGTGTAPDGVTPTSTISDAKGLLRQTYSEFPEAGSIFHIRRASGAETVYTIDENNFVTNVSDGINNWAYAWYFDGDYLSGTQTDPLTHQTNTYAYTTGSQLRSLADGLGHQTSYEYDVNGRLTKVAAPEGDYAQYTYDARGNVTQTTLTPKSGSGLTATTTYASFPTTCSSAVTCNKPTSMTDAKGAVTNYSYNATTGLVTQVDLPAPTTGAVRPQTRYGYSALNAYVKNASGSIVATSTPIYKLTSASACATASSCAGTADETLTTYAYGTAGVANNLLPTAVTIAAGDGTPAATTAATYDYSGNVASIDGPLAGSADTRTTIRDSRGLITEAVSPDPDGSGPLKNRAVAYGYNSDDQIATISRGTANSDGSGFAALTTATNAYNAIGQKTQTSRAGGGTTYSVTQYSYDADGRPDCTAVRMNPAAFGSLPGACSLSSAGSYGPDRIVKTSYDAADQLTKTTSAYGTADQADDAASTYTDNGMTGSVTDAEGNKTSYVYDGFDRLSKTLYPSTTKGAGTSNSADYEQLGYDANSNVTSRRTRANETLTYGFDALNRLTQKSVPASSSGASAYSTYYSYDLLGRAIFARFGSSTGSGVTNIYDALGRLSSTSTDMSGSARTISYQWDLHNNRTRLTHPDGNYATYTYDGLDRMTGVFEVGGGGLASYTYDDSGARVAMGHFGIPTTSYGYDAVGRLTSLAHDVAGSSYDESFTYSYNPAGQIATRQGTNDSYAWTGHYNVNRGYTANGLNQYTASGAANPTYDGNGNLVSDGSTSFVYDAENHLVSASGGHSATIAYDPLGRMWQLTSGSVTTQFLYDGAALLDEFGPSGNYTSRYAHGADADEPVGLYPAGSRVAPLTDERGTVISKVDFNGNGSGINTYDEYGIPRSSNTGRFQYTGQMWLPEIGLYYYKARIYSPTLGRFLQTDPIGYEDGLNAYGYVHADPIGSRDPSGLQAAYHDRYHVHYYYRDGPYTGLNTGGDLMATWPDGGDMVNRDLNREQAAAHARLPVTREGCKTLSTGIGALIGGGIGFLVGGGGGGVVGAAGGTLVAPGVGTVGGGVVGAGYGATNGALIGGGLGAAAGAIAGSILCSKGTPPSIGGNDRENRQAADARREAERRTGKKFDRDKQRQLHDRITGQDMDYNDLVDEAVEVLNGR